MNPGLEGLLPAKCGSSAPGPHRHKAVLSPVALTFEVRRPRWQAQHCRCEVRCSLRLDRRPTLAPETVLSAVLVHHALDALLQSLLQIPLGLPEKRGKVLEVERQLCSFLGNQYYLLAETLCVPHLVENIAA